MDAASLHGFASVALLALGTAIAWRPKTRSARHETLGRIYLAGMLPSLGLAMAAGARDPGLTVFEVIAPTVAVGLVVGRWAVTASGRRRLGPRWLRVHVTTMGTSLISLYTAGTIQLVSALQGGAGTPLLWLAVVPTVVGAPLIESAIGRRAPRRAAPCASTA
jgi:hypothetical protein